MMELSIINLGLTDFIAIAVYMASLIISYFRGIIFKQVKTYIIIASIWIIIYLINLILSKTLIIDEVGIVVAGIIVSMPRVWIVYIGPIIAIIPSLIKRKVL